MPLLDRRPRGLLRLVLRAPVLLYRAGLGRLLGHRFLYLAHVGRTTGRRRDVVLEVVRYDADRPEAVVVAAWGSRSDWYRNLMARPALEVRLAGMRWREPRHRVLGVPEETAALRDYARRHPRAWRTLAPRLGVSTDGSVDASAVATAAQRFPAVSFSPRPPTVP